MSLFDFSDFPTQTTERLVLRQLTVSDAEAVFVIWSDPIVQRFNAEPIQHMSEAHTLLEQWRAEYDARTNLMWAVALRESDFVVGLVEFHHWDRYHHKAEIGYSLARQRWGQGIASEALKAMLHFGIESMELHRIEANTIADNVESVRLLERLGFQREGTRRESSREDDGTYHDSALYGLLRREFIPGCED
jgi:[ribosomal protein S5]-alanine N-acetyltransferase